ncbi:M23 family metallopeptidase [Paraconexibacter algicola]|uniref:M23 family metallopeptidase n=1 Tax=Paraconexibacter algicola TaxID=2133960 RepID=UPI001304F8BA|nr:M23 family metallopeptidase [Paraconexibacter algicola]
MAGPRQSLLPTCALVATVAGALASSADASAGGAQVPPTHGGSGGAEYGQVVLSARDPRPVAQSLRVRPGSVTEGTTPPRITFRIEQQGVLTVRARLVLWPARGTGQVLRVGLGRVRTGRTITVRWPRGTRLVAGRYTVRLHATGPGGGTLLRRARASGRASLVVRAAPRPAAIPTPAASPTPTPSAPLVRAGGVFPVQGPWSFGGDGARFGAARDGHVHQGQDIVAARGVPVVAPTAGTVRAVDYQRDGAGWYAVIDAVDGRSFFFAHCRAQTVVVRAGQPVTPGQRVCDVGNTGASSGPHLHFEIWTGGWRVDARSTPVDPLPQLRAWAGR